MKLLFQMKCFLLGSIVHNICIICKASANGTGLLGLWPQLFTFKVTEQPGM